MQLLHFPCPASRTGEDVLSGHLELERGAPFCANPACALHVRAAGSAGRGRWQLGGAAGRAGVRPQPLRDGLLCDACGTRRGTGHALQACALTN